MSAEKRPCNKSECNRDCGNNKPNIGAAGDSLSSGVESHETKYVVQDDESDARIVASVEKVRRLIASLCVVATFCLISSPTVVSSATTTTAPPAPTTTVAGFETTTTTSTTTTTTTTTLPVAATTVPEGCALPPVAQAVFKGTVKSLDTVSAVYMVDQLRAGSLEGYVINNEVEVRYGSDAKYLTVGTTYLVGVEQDSVTLRLTSTLRDQPQLFGGAEGAGSRAQCPQFEAAARTLNVDGTSIPTGMFDKFFEEPWKVAAAFVLPLALVVCALFGLVWFRRGIRRR